MMIMMGEQESLLRSEEEEEDENESFERIDMKEGKHRQEIRKFRFYDLLLNFCCIYKQTPKNKHLSYLDPLYLFFVCVYFLETNLCPFSVSPCTRFFL